MAKTNITQYSSTPSSNTDINNINIDENCPASGLNNAIRELMAHLKNVDTGSQALTALSVTGNVSVGGTFTSTGIDDNASSTAMTLNSSGNVILPNDASDLTFNTNSLHIGASADIKIGHANNNNGILSDNGMPFTIFTDVFRVNSADNSENLFGADKNSSFFAKFDNSTKIKTVSNGIEVTGGVYIGGTGSANYLDDYEEGTANLSFSSVGSSFNYTYRKCFYTKVGNIVHINVYMQLDGAQTLSANTVTITGLPFTSVNDAAHQASACCRVRFFNFSSGYTYLIATVGSNTTQIGLLQNGDNVSGGGVVANQLSNNSGQIVFNLSYRTA